MTDLRKAAEMALNALKISTPVYSPHKFTQALKALETALAQPELVQVRPHEFIAMASKQANMIGKPVVWAEYPTPHKIILDEGWEWGHEARTKEALAQPEQEPVAWRNAAIRLGEDLHSVGPDGYYNMTAKQWLDWALSVVNIAQPEQEEPLPLVDIGVDVTPEGAHVVACYNRPDAVQEMFYSQFHPLAKPEQSKYSDIVSDGGLDPRNRLDAQPEQEPVAQIRIKNGYWIDTPRSAKVKSLPDGLHDLYTSPPRKPWVGLTQEERDELLNGSTHIPSRLIDWVEQKLKEKNNGNNT